MKLYITIIAVLFSFTISISSVNAVSTHNYICADFDALSGATCSGNTITFHTGVSEYISDDNGTFTMSNGTWYLSVVYSGSGTARWLCGPTGTPTCNTPSTHGFTTTLVAEPFTVDSGGAGTLYFRNDLSGYFAGTLTNICITDTDGACEGTEEATSTIATTTDMTYKDWLFINSIIIFLLMFIPIGTVWSIFKKS